MSDSIPFLWFNDNAEAAVNQYVSLFKDSKITGIYRYGKEDGALKGRAMAVTFELNKQKFMALNGWTDIYTGNAKDGEMVIDKLKRKKFN